MPEKVRPAVGEGRRADIEHEGGSFVDNTMLVGLSRQMVLRRELDIAANNLANLGTTGFKSEGLVFQEYLSPQARADGASTRDRRLSFVEDKAGYTDFAKGPLQVTDNPLDAAIDGDGFFVVQTEKGERYTRAGSFKIDSTRRLVTASGQPVLGSGGPITFSQDERDISIGRDGTISTSDGVKGRLRLVKFDNPQALKRQGGNLFAADQPPVEIEPGKIRVLQGSLEHSNVQPIAQTTRIIEITRAYEQISALMQKNADLHSTAIERLGELPS
jgi:flagellar basal-body rod protein FlgF